MKSIAFIFTILLVLAIPALAQENQTTDLCTGITCSDSTLTCPDGFSASCSNTCNPDTGCSSCEPDCTGHEAPVCGDGTCEGDESPEICPEDCMPAPCMVPCPPYSEKTCPDGYVASCPNTLDSGACKCIICEPDCTGHEAAECIGEGEGYMREGDKQCCAGLNPISASVGDGRTCSLTAGYYCSACGNGECERPESACNCPEDCPCPEGQTESFFCSDRVTRVPWCECSNGKWVCVLSPESQCPETVCGNGICEPGETWDKIWCEEDCPPVPPHCICPDVYEPVCGADGNTYPNSCEAKCIGRISIECYGECPCLPVCGNRICEDIERTAEYACREDCPCQCPIENNPVCGADGKAYPNPCEAMKCADVEIACSGICPCPISICGDGFCGYGEECPVDCCPVEDVCPDGVTIPCKLVNSECICDKPCPLPPECREEKDPQGFVHVVCEEPVIVCPPIPMEWEQKCIAKGGRPVRKTGPPPGNCLFVDCIFKDTPTLPITPIECPPPEEINEVFAKCADAGQEGVIVFKSGCKIAKCKYDPEPPPCPPITYRPEEENLKDKCFEMGLEVIEDFDPMGCPFLRCGEPGKLREIPREARKKCREMGGEFIENRDEFGYIVFQKCIMPGEHEIHIEPIRRVPDVTKLLEMAFKLENLKIELDRLGRRSDDIADYYERTGSPEAERFRRVADMFYSAMKSVDDIKAKLRERLDSITISDLMDIKHDVIYIKDVILKDILYLMLSTGDDVGEVVRGDVKDCGRDGECFDRAFRTCKKVTFRPEETGPIAEIKGLEGDLCILYVFVEEGLGPPPGMIPGVYPPYQMTCRVPDYSLGVRNPEESIFPYCEGSMIEVLKRMAEQPGEISGPGGCTSDEECKEYCSRPENAEECMEFAQKEGFEQRQCSGCLDNGICDPSECPGCPDCPTKEENEFEIAFRECKPGVYKPPNGGPIVDILGLEDGLCVLYLFVPEDEPYPSGEVIITPEEWDPPYEMTCRVPDYYLGTEPPEERILPYCEGPLLEIIEKSRKVVQGVIDCGMDGGGCFDRAFRECKPAIFEPAGSGTGMAAKIKGLEGELCILTQAVEEGVPCCPSGMTPEEWNPPYEMVCKVPNYHLGINPPEENVLPYCEGSLVEIIYKTGPRPV